MQCSSIVIGLAEPYLDLLAEPKERSAEHGNRQKEKEARTVDMLQPEEGAGEGHDKQQARTRSAGKREACSIVQQASTSPQPWKVRFEVGTGSVSIVDVVQIANAFENSGQPALQDGDEAGDSAENESWCCCLRNYLGELDNIRRDGKRKCHVRASSARVPT